MQTNDITLSQTFAGAGTGTRAKVIAPNLVVQATPGVAVTVEGTNFPDEASSWQSVGSHSSGYTPTSLATAFAWIRVTVNGAGDVRISGAQAATGAGGGGGGGGAVTVANGADVTQGAIADAAAAAGATGTVSAKLRAISRDVDRVLVRTALLTGATTTGAGAAVPDSGRAPSFTGNVSGTGAVSATVQIQARNTASGQWVTLGTLTMSGTTTAADGFGSLVRYMEYRANVTSISGTSAAVTVTMGS